MRKPENIVFDLGGVLFARDTKKLDRDFIDFFSYILQPEMPDFWVSYDRGTRSYEEVLDDLCRYNSCDAEKAANYLRRSILMQEPIPATERLIGELKTAGYGLYVLSNMSREFIDFLRRIPVYAHFDGEVVSCEERVVKPERRIYEILLDRYGLAPEATLFIDDRRANVEAAAELGIGGFVFDHHDPELSCRRLRSMLLDDANL